MSRRAYLLRAIFRVTLLVLWHWSFVIPMFYIIVRVVMCGVSALSMSLIFLPDLALELRLVSGS